MKVDSLRGKNRVAFVFVIALFLFLSANPPARAHQAVAGYQLPPDFSEWLSRKVIGSPGLIRAGLAISYSGTPSERRNRLLADCPSRSTHGHLCRSGLQSRPCADVPAANCARFEDRGSSIVRLPHQSLDIHSNHRLRRNVEHASNHERCDGASAGDVRRSKEPAESEFGAARGRLRQRRLDLRRGWYQRSARCVPAARTQHGQCQYVQGFF